MTPSEVKINSQYIFNESDMKARLIRKAVNWFVGEYKTPEMEQWFPWIAGTREWLSLTDKEVAWSKDG